MADQMVAMVNEKILLNTADFINNTNMALTMVQDDVNNGLFGPLKDTVGAINGTMNNVIDDVIKFLKETLHLDVLGPLIDRLMNCLIRFRLKGLEEIMKIIMNMGLNLPRINPDKFKVSETGVQQDLLELNHYLFGENLDGRGGKVGFVLGKLEQRVYRQILFYIIAILVGSTIAWQGLLAYLYMKSHNLPKAAEFDLPLHSIDEEEKPHNKH
jgi:hypothetical protein